MDDRAISHRIAVHRSAQFSYDLSAGVFEMVAGLPCPDCGDEIVLRMGLSYDLGRERDYGVLCGCGYTVRITGQKMLDHLDRLV